MMKSLKGERGRGAGEGGYEALQSMLTGEYTEESTGARTIRQTGGKDRHSKVFTSRGARDRRVRLSVATAIRFYDLQDRLGFEQPSKAVEWLLLRCQPYIQALPKLVSLHPHVRITALPQSAHIRDHPPPHIQSMELKPSLHEHIIHYDTIHNHLFGQDNQHKQKTNQAFWRLNHDDHSLDPTPLYDAAHAAQEYPLEEDPPQSSNPSSSGASSDHPISLSKVSHNSSSETAVSTEAMPIFPNHIATSLGMPQQLNLTSAPLLLCSNKKRRMQSPACFSHAHSDYYAGLASNGNSACTSANIVNAIDQCGSLTTDERLLSTNNVQMSHTNCSNIGLNTGVIYDTPHTNYALISNYMNMSSNIPLNNQSANVLLSNSGKEQQMSDAMQQNMARLASFIAEPNKYVDMAVLRDGTESSGVANDTGSLMMSGNIDDTMQIYGKMATTYSLSPSESNNINQIELAGSLDIGKASSAHIQMQANDQAAQQQQQQQQLVYRPSCDQYWT